MFTGSEFSFSRFSTKDTLQDTARAQFENNKKQRRNIFAQAAQAASRGNEWGVGLPNALPVPVKDRMASRVRSGSGTSRTTATSDSGDPDMMNTGCQLSSSPSQPSTGSSSGFFVQSHSSHHTPHVTSSNISTLPPHSGTPKGSSMIAPPSHPASALSPIASRMRERDADAMEKYLNRNRSGSQGTASTDTKSQNESHFASAGPSSNGDDITALMSGTITPRKLRPSVSAAQLRTTQIQNSSGSGNVTPQHESVSRNRSGTSPSTTRNATSPLPLLARSSSTSKSLRSIGSVDRLSFDDTESFTGPPSQYAQFPGPPFMTGDQSTPTNGRRKAFNLLSKPLQTFENPSTSSHRRGISTNSARGS